MKTKMRLMGLIGLMACASQAAPTVTRYRGNVEAMMDGDTNKLTLLNSGDPFLNGVYNYKGVYDTGFGLDHYWTNASGNLSVTFLDSGTYYTAYDIAQFVSGDYAFNSGGSNVQDDWQEYNVGPPTVHFFGSATNALTVYGEAQFLRRMKGNAGGLTNLQSANLVGAVPTSALYPVRSNAMGSCAISFSNLDNNVYVQIQKGAQAGTYSNWNRFGWTNTISKLKGGKTVTLLAIGDGLSAGGHLWEALLRWPTNTLPFAGYRSTTPWKGLVMTVSGSATAISGQDSVYVKGTRGNITGSGGTVNITNNMPQLERLANVFGVAYLQNTGAGTFSIQTQQNGGTWTTVSGLGAVNANGTYGAQIINWTNPTLVTATMRCVGVSGAVSILDGCKWDNTQSNAYCAAQLLGISSVAMTEYIQSRETVLKPIRNWIAPDLCIFSKIGMSQADCNFLDTNSCTSLFDLMNTNASGAIACDMVLTGLYPFTAGFTGCYNGQEQSVVENSYLCNFAKGRGWSYWDGFSPFRSNAAMVGRGLIPAGDVHATAAGYSAFDELLVDWLALGQWRQAP